MTPDEIADRDTERRNFSLLELFPGYVEPATELLAETLIWRVFLRHVGS